MIDNTENSTDQLQKKEKATAPLSFKIKQLIFAGLMGFNPFLADSVLEKNNLYASSVNEIPPAVAEYNPTDSESDKKESLFLKTKSENISQIQEIFNNVNQIHLQHDENEYLNQFDSVLEQYLEWGKNGINYCGPATLLNLLDTLSQIRNDTTSNLSIIDFMNKYLVDNGSIATAYENQGLVINQDGTMSPRAVYGLAEQIAHEHNYDLQILHGSEDFYRNPPLKKEDLRSFVEDNQNFFDQGGVAIMLLSRNLAWEGEVNEEANPHFKAPGFYHYVLLTDMMINPDDSVSFLIADSLGVNGDGFLGYVRMDNNSYTIPVSDYSEAIYTGINKVFLLTPSN